jgi:hypothetical protein
MLAMFGVLLFAVAPASATLHKRTAQPPVDLRQHPTFILAIGRLS